MSIFDLRLIRADGVVEVARFPTGTGAAAGVTNTAAVPDVWTSDDPDLFAALSIPTTWVGTDRLNRTWAMADVALALGLPRTPRVLPSATELAIREEPRPRPPRGGNS